MNNIKRELKEVLEEKERFTEKNINYIIQQIQEPKRKNWTPLFVVASFVALLVLFISVKQPNDQQAQFTRYFESKMKDVNYEIIFQQFNYLKDNDALVAFIERHEEEKIYLAYFEYQNGWQWRQTTGTQSKPYLGKEFWGSTVQAPYMYAGVIETAMLQQIIVGEQKATLIPLEDGLTYWFAVSDKAARIVVQDKNNVWERLAGDIYQDDSIKHIPLIDSLSEEQYAIKLTNDTMEQGNQEYTQYPIVADPKFDTLDRSDVILYTDKDGQQVVSRILGLPNETIEITNGTVVINTIPIPHYHMYAKIMGETVYESYIEKFKNPSNAQEIFFYNYPVTQLSDNEIFVIPDNWSLDKIEKVSFEQVDAKVLGYDSKSMEKHWTEEERNLYNEFKSSNNLEVFQHIDPITYVRTQLYARFIVDKRADYRMYTTNPEHVQWTEEQHIRQNNSLSQLENERRYAIYYAQLLQNGEFQFEGNEGAIIFNLPNGDLGMWRMVQNQNGLWQSSFLSLQ